MCLPSDALFQHLPSYMGFSYLGHGSFRYDLNQIPYDYIVEVRNRFKRLDLIDRMPDELWMEVHDIIQVTEINTIPKKKKCKRKRKLAV